MRRTGHAVWTERRLFEALGAWVPEVDDPVVKVTLATTLKEGGWWCMRSMPGNPYDGHTLNETIEQGGAS